MAGKPLWRRSLSVVVGTDRPESNSTITLIRSHYSLPRRVAAIVFGIDLPVGRRPRPLALTTPKRSETAQRVSVAAARTTRMRLALAASAVVVASVGVSYSLLTLRVPVTAAPPSYLSVVTTGSTTAASQFAVTTTPANEASAQALLGQQVATDHSAVEALVSSWVPEVSAKTLGLVADGITYDYQQIWADYQRLAAAYPGALLLKSGDYVTFQRPNFWITVVPTPFRTAAAANAWCDSHDIGPSDCFAARLTHAVGSQGNTVTRN